MSNLTSELTDIYLFNPTSDFAIANGSRNWQPNKTLQKMEADLTTLPMFFARKNDVVLVDEIPDNRFISTMQQLGFIIPHFVSKNEIQKNQTILNDLKNRLIPWGWSPAAHHLLAPLKSSCSADFQNSPIFNWSEQHREICSRKFASEILRKVVLSLNSVRIIASNEIPVICDSQADIDCAIAKWGDLILKAPWSSSGRGLQPITKTPVHPKVWEKIDSIIGEQGYIMAEKLQNKIHDMAFLFEMKNGTSHFLGVSHFFTNEKGQYAGNWLNGRPDIQSNEINDFINNCIAELTISLKEIIDNSVMAKIYEGVFGIDMLIFRNKKGELQINPCLEINARHTMGMVSLQLEKWLGVDIKAVFKTYYQAGTSFKTFKTIMEQKHPFKLLNGKYHSGFLALTPANETTQFGAYLLS